MKLILKEYLASLREREELDAILPDLLSEIGFRVYSRPERGTTQHGVDIAAVSPGRGDKRRIYLFAVKKGDLTRQDWNGTPQALRASLDQIRDVYIRTKIPPEYASLKIVICLCFGGDIKEQVRADVAGYISTNTSERINFEEWNGDAIADLLLQGILKEDLLPKPLRSSFQKAIALLDEPDVSYRHFADLINRLRSSSGTDARQRIRAARQIYICLWVLYVWGRDVSNIESPYLGSELAILNVWEIIKPFIDKKDRNNQALTMVLHRLIELHLAIASELVKGRLAPGSKSRDALAMAVMSRAAVDVNIKLFDMLGRISMIGMWINWADQRPGAANHDAAQKSLLEYYDIALSMIENNGTLWLPVADNQGTDVALALLLWLASNADKSRLTQWLEQMVHRYEFTFYMQGRYPTSFTDYRDLADHPRERSKEYFEEATAGSTLIPLLTAWLLALGEAEGAGRLTALAQKKLEHCTMQLWSPAVDSEEHIYVNSESHGRALCDLPLKDAGSHLLASIADACKSDQSFDKLSAVATGNWPIILLACRHWRLPIPPEFYIKSLVGEQTPSTSDSAVPEGKKRPAPPKSPDNQTKRKRQGRSRSKSSK